MLLNIELQCDPEQNFTCWNGDCISLDKRCDETKDCKDGSDENECTYIKVNTDQYRKEFKPQDQMKLEVKVGFDVLDIVEISEPKERILYYAEFFEN